MSQKNFLPVLYKHGAHPQSNCNEQESCSANCGCECEYVCVGCGVKEQCLYFNPIHICLPERQVQSHTHGKTSSILRTKKTIYLMLCPHTIYKT